MSYVRRVAKPSSRAQRQDRRARSRGSRAEAAALCVRELQLASLEELSPVQGDEEEQAERGGGRSRAQEAGKEGRSSRRHTGLQVDRSGRPPHDGEVPEVRLDPSLGRIDGEEDSGGRS